MKSLKFISQLLSATLALVGLTASVHAAEAAMPLAIHGETIYPVSGAPIKNGLILVDREGKIAYVGTAEGHMYTADHRVVRAKVVTPGLIDAHATVGLSGIANQPQDQDVLEKSGAFQPELRALDAYNAKDPLVAYVRSFGVTTVNTGPSAGALSGGQTLVAKTLGRTADEDVIVPIAMTSIALGNNALNREGGKSPGTRSKAVSLLRSELIKTQEYAKKREAKDESKRPGRDLKYDTLLRAFDGTQPLLITAHRQQDIASALRIAAEFKLKIILDGCADAPLVLDAIKASGFPVVLHPTMARSNEDAENLSFETAAKLKAAGIPFAIQSGYEAYVPKTRIVLMEAAVAAANGLGFEAALKSVTLDAAKILGVDKRIGSLEVGKHADLALYDGDPFEYTSHATGTVINGQLFDEGAH